jgi:hypothetical protein
MTKPPLQYPVVEDLLGTELWPNRAREHLRYWCEDRPSVGVVWTTSSNQASSDSKTYTVGPRNVDVADAGTDFAVGDENFKELTNTGGDVPRRAGLVAPVAGRYTFFLEVRFEQDTSGYRRIGYQTSDGYNTQWFGGERDAATSSQSMLSAEVDVELNEDDIIFPVSFQNSGGSLEYGTCRWGLLLLSDKG